MSKFTANEITTKRLEISTGTTNQTFQFSEVDTTVLNSGIDKGQTYEYTLNFEGDVGMTAEIRLVGKVYTGDNTQWFTVLFVVVEDEIAYTDAINVLPEFVRCFITKSYSGGVTSYKLEMDHQLNTTMYFTAYIDGYSFKNKANTSSVATYKLFGDRGVFGGGFFSPPSTYVCTLDYITISTPGIDAITFGELTESRYSLAATSDGSIGVFGGGYNPTAPVHKDTIDYITIATPGNADTFGVLTESIRLLAATSDGSRGVFGGGQNNTPVHVNTIDYITISTPGDATTFGELTESRQELAATSDGNRGVFGGGYNPTAPTYKNTIDYITISTPGNATTFGALTESRNGLAATSDGSRGVFGGGFAPPNVCTLDYITIATPGDATVFGALTDGRRYLAATSDGSRGVFGGGYDGVSNLCTLDYITIATPGDATAFGALTEGRRVLAATSGD